MKSFLQDLVAHTYNLGFLPLVKVSATDDETVIESMAEDRSVIVNAKTHNPVTDVEGTFGMPNLDKLSVHLKCPEYREDAKITVVREQRNGLKVATGIHFENAAGDFENDYRFMNSDIINDKLKSVKFKGAKWLVEFEPSAASIQRLKFQAIANTDETTFQVSTDNNKNLVFSFGDGSSHAGSFIFQSEVAAKLKQTWSWPVARVLSILNLDGKIVMKFSDVGALQITVDSGLAEYNYILPALTK